MCPNSQNPISKKFLLIIIYYNYEYFQTYQINDFNNLGYKLYKVNHSVLFGKGHFHTNSIEST